MVTVATAVSAVAFAQQAAPTGSAPAPGGQGRAGGGQRGGGRGGTPTIPGQNRNGMHIYLRGGLKTHGAGQHDYPQFVADWSNILTERGAIVDGAPPLPDRAELEDGRDRHVQGRRRLHDAGEKAALEAFLKRGGGLVGIHDTICGHDPAWFSTVFGGAKKHGETNFTLDANVPYTIVDKASPIMQGIPDFALKDESFYSMTWAKQPEDPRAGDREDRRHAERRQRQATRASRAADVDLRAHHVRRQEPHGRSSGCRDTSTRTSPTRASSPCSCAASPGPPVAP